MGSSQGTQSEKTLRRNALHVLQDAENKLRKLYFLAADIYIEEGDKVLRAKLFRFGLICEKLADQQKRNSTLLEDKDIPLLDFTSQTKYIQTRA